MAFGIQWINNSGAVAISSDKYGLAYLGQATYTGTAKSDAYTSIGSGGTGGYVAGVKDPFYIYTIVSPTLPLVFIQLLSVTQYFAVCSVTNTGGNNWEIVVGGNNWSTVPILKCFGRLSGPGSPGMGLRVKDAAGERCWDSTENMLVMRRRDNWASASNSSTTALLQSVVVSGLSSPYLMAANEPRLCATRASAPSGSVYTITEYISGWAWEASTSTLYRRSTGVVADKYLEDFNLNNNSLPADRSFLISGDEYP